MSSVLMTSTMKSEPGLPPSCPLISCGVPVSAAAILAVGGSAEGRGGGATGVSAEVAANVAALAPDGAVTAAPATATPAKNLRRLNLVCESSRAMPVSYRFQPHA